MCGMNEGVPLQGCEKQDRRNKKYDSGNESTYVNNHKLLNYQ